MHRQNHQIDRHTHTHTNIKYMCRQSHTHNMHSTHHIDDAQNMCIPDRHALTLYTHRLGNISGVATLMAVYSDDTRDPL